MRVFLILILSLFVISCESVSNEPKGSQLAKDTLIVHDTIFVGASDNWQENFGLSHDPEKDSVWFKPVSYYLNDSNCSGLALDFYYGTLRPGDNGSTDELLKLATVSNRKLRPFYRWCLNKTIQIQDGALAEHTGVPARKYVERYPKEFFEYMDVDTSGQRYKDWVSAISYSGFYGQDDYKNGKEVAIRFASVMKANCKNCNENLLRRIDLFAASCYQ